MIMNGDNLVRLIEEMMDLKVQHYAESHLKHNPEVAKLLVEKRETDRRRLEQIRAELARLINAKIFGVVQLTGGVSGVARR
jgi:hypothetical protein